MPVEQFGEDPTIINPVIGTLGKDASLTGSDPGGGVIVAQLIVIIWRSLMTVGGLLVLIWIIYGGITWLTAGGSKEKIENARNRIINAIIGMAILFAAAAFVNFIGPAIGFDLLKFELPRPAGSY